MSNPSKIKVPSVHPRQTGTKPKSKLLRLTSAKFSPKKQQSSSSGSSSEISQIASSSPKRCYNQSEELQKQLLNNNSRQSPSPKHSPRRHQDSSSTKRVSFEEDFQQDNMGLVQDPDTMYLNMEPAMSFLEFESLYNLEKELEQARKDTIAELDEKCIFGGWFGTRRGVYTELPDPTRNIEWMPRGQIIVPPPSEGFSFAPGWSLNAEHFYQWQQRGKNIQQVYLY